MNVAAQRLHNQYISRVWRRGAAALVASLGAVQAQEYPFAKWALGLRMSKSTSDADVERALENGEIVRTHVLRPTWHFVAAEDLVWMLELTGPRVLARMAPYAWRRELDPKLLARTTAIVAKALEGRRYLTRADLKAGLQHARINLATTQWWFTLMYAELHGVICSGPRRGKQSTYALVSERVPKPRRLRGDEALAELAGRFFASHGPATVRDFVWWSGLTTADARRGLDIIRAVRFDQDGLTYWTSRRGRVTDDTPNVHLLPIYDEYVVAYRDRHPVPLGPVKARPGKPGLVFRHFVIADGTVAGTWRIEVRGDTRILQVIPLRRLTGAERDGIQAAADRFERFFGTPLRLAS